MASKLLPLRRLSALLRVSRSCSASYSNHALWLHHLGASRPQFNLPERVHQLHRPVSVKSFCFGSLQTVDEDSQGPAAIDYRSLLEEGEFHKLANSTIHSLQETLEEYGDNLQIDGFDVDYGNEVLTLRLGSLGTYVLNKQTPNRQIWLSSPVSGPFRFDWDQNAQGWIYRRTKANLLKLLETELEQLCGEPIHLS